MKAYAQKQNQPQQQASPNITRSNARSLAATPIVDSTMPLHGTIGNQAVQRLLGTNVEALDADSNTAATSRFAHDFSRIPVHSKAPVKLQAKLKVNTPGDVYEQEADLIAEQIMRMPASEVSAGPPWVQPMPRESEHKQAGRTLRTQGSSAATESEPLPATEATVRALDSSGEPLQAALRSFFEPRFGHSFEQVRVHTDAAAATSSQDLNALAYTRGRHIVFAPGQFEPHTQRGQRLLAHELTHVVQQGWAGRERIQRAYLAPTPDATVTQEVPQPVTAIMGQEDETLKIQRAPGPDTPGTTPAPTLASPTITLSPSDTIVRGDTITAQVAFSPSAAGETLKVTDWQYTTGGGDIITRPKTDAKFQSEWKGVMALSGKLELKYTVKPKGKPATAGTAITSAVTVNDRTGPDWQTTTTDETETPLSGKPSPPEKAEELGTHVVPGGPEPAAGQTLISSGPNAGLTYVDSVQDRNLKSEPHIHPDVTNAASPFRVFHRDAGRLYFVTKGGRTLIPSTEYTALKITGGTITFNVPNWTAFYKKFGILTITFSGGGNTVTAKPGWWILEKNTRESNAEITDPDAVRAALGVGARDRVSITMNFNGSWEAKTLMPSANIPAATRSHEFTHATHSHRANFHKIVRALDPRQVMESTVATPSNPVTFRDRIHGLMTEIAKPNHELVDEAASKAAGNFVPVSGKTMAAVNIDPASGANLGAIWDITHDKEMS